MNRRLLFCGASSFALLVFSSLVVRADVKDDLKAAVQKLADAPNYSWTSTVEGGMGGNTTGKTVKDGYTWLKITVGDNDTEAVLKGGKAVAKADAGWQTPDEMAADQGPGRFLARMLRAYKTPAEQAGAFVDKLDHITKSDDGYTASLTQDGVKSMLTMGGRGPNATPPTISNASGDVKVSVSAGNVTKMVVHIVATVDFNGNSRDIDRTTTTEINGVGATAIDVPADAKAKLNSATTQPAAAR